MRQSRIHTTQLISPQCSVELTDSAAHYLSRVLRLSKGDAVTLFNGDGKDYAGDIVDIKPRQVLIRVTGSSIPGNESPLKITLVQGVCRGERMDYALQKATELGVVCIQPLVSRRVGVRLDQKRQVKRLAHWQKVVISACEQCGRALVPEVKAPLMLSDWISGMDQYRQVVLDPESEVTLSGLSVGDKPISILVGPEGGFADEELELLVANGVVAVSLGPRVLRTETAGAAAIAVLQAIGGDF